MSKVSVIISTYNRREKLKKALLSVLSQTHKANEIIVIDDGSEDNTKLMINEEFPNVIYHYQQNKGVSAARNRAISMSRGEWLAFLDSDDQWLADKLQTQIDKLNANPTIKVCHTEEIWIRNGVRVNAMKKHAKKGGWIFQHCLPLCAMSPSSIMVHSSVLEHIGTFDENLPACEDYDLWLRISAQYPVLYIEQPMIVKHGGHADQLSRKYWGMDRFRIQALHKILSGNTLTKENHKLAAEMIVKKCRIYSNGAQKRGKYEEAAYYQQLAEQYR